MSKTTKYGPGMDHTGTVNCALPPRGVAFGKPEPGMRNHDCRVDGHSFDGGLCIYCDTRADPPWEGTGKGIYSCGEKMKMAADQTTRPTWVVAADMPSSQRAWYWSEFPGSWVFYSPEMNATRDIDQGNTGWHPLISGRYWGPWTEHTLAALQLEVAHVAGTAPREAVPPVPAQMMFPHTYSTLEPPRQMEASMKAIKDALDAGYQNAVAALEDVAGCFGDEQAQATVRAAAKILTRVKPQ